MGELVTSDMVGGFGGGGGGSGGLSLHLRLGLASPVTHLLSPRPLICKRPLGIDYCF